MVVSWKQGLQRKDKTMIRTCLAAAVALLWTAGCVDTTTFEDSAVSPPDGARADAPPWPDGLIKPDSTCGYYSVEAKQSPAAMMIVLDRSSSMSTSGKWAAAQQAIVKAIDKSAFDYMSLGLMAYPAFKMAGPLCLLFIQVSCGISSLPQVPLNDSGTNKSNASSGPRRQIYDWLVKTGPDNTATDASPGYDALNRAILTLQGHAINGKRLVLFITDGGFSCTSVSKPARPGYSDGLCPDWEYPASVIALLKKAHDHPTTPVSTFIVGVPGSDSTGNKQGPYATAPYHMKLALSAYAYAGSPGTVDPTCNGRTFSKTGADPSKPCHFDMTVGTFDANALAQVIENIRGKALGCSYQLPKVDDKNRVIDKNKVNVRLTLDSGKPTLIPRRATTLNSCTKEACWDLDTKKENVLLIGKACSDVKSANKAKVEIIVGCQTIIK
jgi:hypothetical protein